MKKQIEDIVKDVCKIGNWKKPYAVSADLPADEREALIAQSVAERQGAVGVACVLAFMQGCKPEVEALSHAIGVSVDDVEEPFKRLIVNGIFSSRYDAKNDPVLAGLDENIPQSDWLSNAERTRNAWCLLAGISAGLTGLREDLLSKPAI